MGILWALVVGLVVGALAKLFMPGKDPGGIIVTMLLGVAGSLVAGFIGRAFGWYQTGTNGPGIIASIIGAMALLGIYRLRHTPQGHHDRIPADDTSRTSLTGGATRSGVTFPRFRGFRVFPWREGRLRSRVRSDRSPHG